MALYLIGNISGRPFYLPPCFFYLVYLPSDSVNVPNAWAYVLSVGDVQGDESKAQIRFNQTPTDHPIVIYGVKNLNLQNVPYNGINDCPSIDVSLYSDETVAQKVGFQLTRTWGFDQLTCHLSFHSSSSLTAQTPTKIMNTSKTSIV